MPATSPARKPRSRYHHGDLRRALIAEAVRTIGVSGVEGLTLREAGRRLGVSRTALYRHFSDKAALLAAVAREGFSQFTRDLRDAWTRGEGTLKGFEDMGAAYVRFAVNNPSHYRVMFGNFLEHCDRDPELSAEAGASFAVLVDAIRSLQADGLIRDDEPVALARFVWATVHGVAMLAIDGQFGPGPHDEVVRFAVQRLGTGVRAETRAEPRARSARGASRG